MWNAEFKRGKDFIPQGFYFSFERFSSARLNWQNFHAILIKVGAKNPSLRCIGDEDRND